MLDVVLLTQSCYLQPEATDDYAQNIVLEDQLLIKPLQALGLSVQRVAWDDPNFDWTTTRTVVFRAVWDYFERITAFTAWYQKAALQTQFVNSVALVSWNMDKHYLQDLQAKTIHIPPTLFVEAGSQITLQQAIQAAKAQGMLADTFVLKPCIAAGARHTYKFHQSNWEAYAQVFRNLVADEAMMLQEFQANIVSKGEVSMMMINGNFTHAVLKRAKKGDFRVQDDWGGTLSPYQPNKAEMAFAATVMQVLPEMPAYARVDIFEDNQGKIALAELEIFEPELWFRHCKEAAVLLAKTLKEKLLA